MGYKHNKEDIIEKGTELFRKKGYNNVGINEILKECEIPKGSFYDFFETKEDLAEKVVDNYGANSLKMIKESLADKSVSPLNRLKQFYSMLIDFNENYSAQKLNSLSPMHNNLVSISKCVGKYF
jgi:TetR/AcrR family transcriptional repressor of nem operon